MIITIINLTSENIPNEEVQRVIRAINRQIAEDFEPCSSFGAKLRLEGNSSSKPSAQSPVDMRGDAILYLWDKTNMKDALGYHFNNKGIPHGFVFTELSKKLGEDWSVTLAHEALELIGDPQVNLLVQGPHPHPNGSGKIVFHRYEMCDAVQDEAYEIGHVKVSNCVLPLYFTETDEAGGRNEQTPLTSPIELWPPAKLHHILKNSIHSVCFWLTLIIAFCPPSPARAEPFEPNVLPLESYEPNTIGYTFDNDDVPFMDFKVSVKYRLFPHIIRDNVSHDSNLYLAFTGRFGQYIAYRQSSPVIGKRFNPKLIWRQNNLAPFDYIDFSYVHESNGQSINSLQQYLRARENAMLRDGNADFANDYLSRGWDYLEVNAKHMWPNENNLTSGYLSAKYFLANGLFQGVSEEYNSWESNPEGKSRKAVNGLSGILKRQFKTGAIKKLALILETGYVRPFKYSTARVEAGTKLEELPITFWWQTGYGSDLAQYYKKTASWGVEMEIGSF
ncbi:MAG: phospholipase A [Nitrosomonadales bacterium]|nr:phospholipase A [Nitrosomonadales bacterium]